MSESMALRFYHAPDDWAEKVIVGDEAHHAIKVLRVKVGEEIEVFDGQGRVAKGKVTNITGKTLGFEVSSEVVENRAMPQIRLYQAIPKGKTMDLIIQKAVELGVAHIQPIVTKNTVAVSDAPAKKAEKWQRVALEASKQCKQSYMPKVEAPAKFSEVSLSWADDELKLVASLRDNSRTMKEVLSDFTNVGNVSLIIGPEGDFTDNELDTLETAGFLPVSMGELTLRVETATLYGISALRFFY